MSQYAYARDGRTDEQYKADFDAGVHNQKVVMEAYVAVSASNIKEVGSKYYVT